MINPLTYINNKFMAHPIVSPWIVGVAALAIGYAANSVHDWCTKVPEAKMGIISDLPSEDYNGDRIKDRIVTRSDGFRHIVLMDEFGKGKGIHSICEEYRNLEASLNSTSAPANKLTPFIKYPSEKKSAPRQGPKLQGARPSDCQQQNNPQNSSSALETIAGSSGKLVPVHFD